jgi:cell division protein ZipA
MGALRWILLLAGVLFMAALAVWERLRPRQGQREGAGRSERSEPPIGTMGPAEPMAPSVPLAGEPGAPSARMYTGASLGGGGRTRSAPPPRIDLPPLDAPEADALAGHGATRMADSEIILDEPISALGPEPYAELLADSAADGAASEPPLPGELPRSPVVDWPPEAERHILSLRIAALSHERLSGRVVRQALGACGFEHGRFGIFHQPGADGRALLSAANLTKPGIFDLPNMDFQRFSGLSLFAVLPGPLPPAAALDHLLDTAQDLAERLRARLQDEQGLALGAMQLENLRRTVQDLTSAERAEPTA